MKWTPAQHSAVYTRSKNLIVSAAAGSGKTAVLTERIVQLVREGADIDRMLVVTFTEAATAQMKRRIAAELMRAAQEETDQNVAKRFQAQALAAGRANISTLHAFCMYILRHHFHKIDMNPAFTVADQILSDILLAQALEQAAQNAYESRDEGFLALLRAFDGNQDALFLQAKRAREFLFAQPEPWEWLEEAIAAYELSAPLEEHPAAQQMLRAYHLQATVAVWKLSEVRVQTPEQYEKVRALLDEDMAQLRALTLARDLSAYRTQAQALTFKNFSGWPRNENPELKDRVHDMRNEALKDIKKQNLLSIEEERVKMSALAPAVRAFDAFMRDMEEEYAALKRERAKVDFSDMEHLALRALADETVARSLRSRFQYVFVDEYQDSSRIQECIIARVQRADNLFLVGDVKQSIYRFRQADPALFLEKLRAYSGEDNAQGMRIHLNTNFRSEQPVIDAVNAVFSRIMSVEAGEIDYDEDAALRRIEDGAAPEALAGVEMHMIDARLDEETRDEAEECDEEYGEDGASEGTLPDEEEEPYENVRMEALLAASRIRVLMREGSYMDEGKARKLRYSDFAVLLRSHRYAGEIWAQTLANEGIPAYVQLTGGYFDAIEVQVFLNLLRVIDNRRQDIPLLSVLRSPVFGFDEPLLVELCKTYPADTLFLSLEQCARGDAPLCMKAHAVFALLAGWKREARLLPLPEFLAQLVEESRLYECMGALSGGNERRGNLDAFIERAREYAKSGAPCDLWSFIQFMDGAANTARMGAAQSGAADVVRVLSMHRSKGLEFPVVILAGLGKRFNRRDEQEPMLFSRELGLGVRWTCAGVKRDTLFRRAIAVSLREKGVAEEMRVLYVGMTRARNRLIMIGTRLGAEEFVHATRHMQLNSAYCARANDCLDWVIPAAVQSGAFPIELHGGLQARQKQPNTVEPDVEDVAAALHALRERFEWRYPYAQAIAVPSKLNVSELTRTHDVVLRAAPSFVQEKRLCAAERGTAVHTVLQRIVPLNGEEDALAQVRAQVKQLTMDGFLSARLSAAIPLRDIAWFLLSDVGKRMQQAPRVERELEFSVEMPAYELMESATDEPVLLQGVIDCCFIEDGAWVLLDYKTDRAEQGVEEAARAHAGQLRLYARALEQLTNIPVRQKYVVLLRARAAVVLD